ncbi:MAG TPA: hydantoinase/carbamoylase family amidase, partial [Caulobacteraceae bacterium]|nr:hydantoinase/carbamoylase family amidase [Caulobacteraceae bacterium]
MLHASHLSPGQRAVARCDALAVAPYSQAAECLDRPYLSGAHRAALDQTAVWMQEAGMTVRIDPLGNLVGRYEGLIAGAKALLIGSHIDTVRDGGPYDGALGVMIGIECAHVLHRAGRRAPFAIEVIAFGDEEGSRFPASMMCSRGMSEPVGQEALAMVDPSGTTLAEAMSAFGLNPDALAKAVRAPDEILAFVEAHIEQGPVLETLGLSVGVVSGIAAQKRLKARFMGHAGHAGTSPMNLRRDAIAG